MSAASEPCRSPDVSHLLLNIACTCMLIQARTGKTNLREAMAIPCRTASRAVLCRRQSRASNECPRRRAGDLPSTACAEMGRSMRPKRQGEMPIVVPRAQ